MNFKLELGLALALACAFVTNLGFLFKHRGACAAPPVTMRHPLRSAIGLFRSKWFSIGFGVAAIAFALHIAALALAPISLVQSVISGGLVFLAVLADRYFGYTLGKRQWVGVGMTAVGLALLALTVPHVKSDTAAFSVGSMIAFEAGAVAIGVLLVMGQRLGATHEHHGMLLGTAAGIMIGVSDIAIKALTGMTLVGVISSPWLALTVMMAVFSFFLVGRGLQIGEAVPVIAMISVAANVVQIIGGLLVFGDPLPASAVGIVAQAFGFVFICMAAVLIPAPVRAARLQTA